VKVTNVGGTANASSPAFDVMTTRRDIGHPLRLRLTARNALGSDSFDLITPGRRTFRR
jgi:hypothetical protein